jgi:hypothetical protein
MASPEPACAFAGSFVDASSARLRRSDPLPGTSRCRRLATAPGVSQIMPVDDGRTPSAKTASEENAAFGMWRDHAAAAAAVVVCAGTFLPRRLRGRGAHREPPRLRRMERARRLALNRPAAIECVIDRRLFLDANALLVVRQHPASGPSVSGLAELRIDNAPFPRGSRVNSRLATSRCRLKPLPDRR